MGTGARELPGDVSELLTIMARLRDPESGCPWDVLQTFATVAPYTIEEAYEVVDAIDRSDYPALRDELGDLLLQVVFHSRMAEEAGHFVFADVVHGVCEKMTRRHPHVFSDVTIASAAEQSRAWEAHKRSERLATDADASALAGIARGMPEWQKAIKLQKRAAAVGFDWPGTEPVIDKLLEEIEEVRREFVAVTEQPDDDAAQARLEDEIGDLLFVAANLARHGKVDPGSALRRANAKFERRFRAMEAMAETDGSRLEAMDLQAQDALWERVKALERAAMKAPRP